MKTLLKTLVFAALPLTGITAEPNPKMHKVVFEVAIDGAENWEGAFHSQPQ